MGGGLCNGWQPGAGRGAWEECVPGSDAAGWQHPPGWAPPSRAAPQGWSSQPARASRPQTPVGRHGARIRVQCRVAGGHWRRDGAAETFTHLNSNQSAESLHDPPSHHLPPSRPALPVLSAAAATRPHAPHPPPPPGLLGSCTTLPKPSRPAHHPPGVPHSQDGGDEEGLVSYLAGQNHAPALEEALDKAAPHPHPAHAV